MLSGQKETPVTAKGGEGPLIPQSTQSIHTSQPRWPFTTEETETISNYFAAAIEAGVNVSIVECKMFLEQRVSG